MPTHSADANDALISQLSKTRQDGTHALLFSSCMMRSSFTYQEDARLATPLHRRERFSDIIAFHPARTQAMHSCPS